MNNDPIDDAKENISICICSLIQIAECAGDRNLVNKLKAQKILLDGLDERIERSALPESFVRSVINDIRLDVIMIYSDIKLLLTHKKLEIVPLTDALESQTNSVHKKFKINDSTCHVNNVFINRDQLIDIEPTLKKLKNIEQLLQNSLL